jgi:hypothetical protein
MKISKHVQDRIDATRRHPEIQAPSYDSDPGEHRCTVERWCPAMLEALNPGTGDGKGLTRNVGWLGADPKDAPPRNLGVTYRKHVRTQGFVVNACPWCRSDIRFWMTEEERLRDPGLAALTRGETIAGQAAIAGQSRSVRPNPCCASFALTGKHWHGCPEVKP